MLTPDDVQAALNKSGLGLKVQFFDAPTATAPEAAAALNTTLGSIVKSLLFMVDGQPVVILTSGDQKVDDKKLAEKYGVPRKKVRIATAEECIQLVGYAPGGVPPVGHRTENLTILIDHTLNRFEMIYAAAGSPNTIFPLTFEQLQQITGGKVASVVKEFCE